MTMPNARLMADGTLVLEYLADGEKDFNTWLTKSWILNRAVNTTMHGIREAGIEVSLLFYGDMDEMALIEGLSDRTDLQQKALSIASEALRTALSTLQAVPGEL